MQLMRDVGSTEGYSPIPPRHYLFQMRRSNPDQKERLMGGIFRHTIHKDYKRAWCVDSEGKPFKLRQLAAELEMEYAEAEKSLRELVAEGRAGLDPQHPELGTSKYYSGRIFLRTPKIDGPEESTTCDFESTCTSKIPASKPDNSSPFVRYPSLLKQADARNLSEEERQRFVAGYAPRHQRNKQLVAEGMAQLRLSTEEEDRLYFEEWGFDGRSPKAKTRRKSDGPPPVKVVVIPTPHEQDLSLLDRALRETGQPTQGAALITIVREYLASKGVEVPGPAAAQAPNPPVQPAGELVQKSGELVQNGRPLVQKVPELVQNGKSPVQVQNGHSALSASLLTVEGIENIERRGEETSAAAGIPSGYSGNSPAVALDDAGPVPLPSKKDGLERKPGPTSQSASPPEAETAPILQTMAEIGVPLPELPAARRILQECRSLSPDCTVGEIVSVLRAKASVILKAQNPMGAAIRYVPPLFQPDSLREMRRLRAGAPASAAARPETAEERKARILRKLEERGM
jgi:hypothetical protein